VTCNGYTVHTSSGRAQKRMVVTSCWLGSSGRDCAKGSLSISCFKRTSAHTQQVRPALSHVRPFFANTLIPPLVDKPNALQPANNFLFLAGALCLSAGHHLRLTRGPAGNRTTTGSLSASSRTTPYQLSHEDTYCNLHATP